MTPAQLDALLKASQPKAAVEPQGDSLTTLKMFERLPLAG